MANDLERSRMNFNGKMVSIGIDMHMHKHCWRITALVDGHIVRAVTLGKPSYASFKKILAQSKGNYV